MLVRFRRWPTKARKAVPVSDRWLPYTTLVCVEIPEHTAAVQWSPSSGQRDQYTTQQEQPLPIIIMLIANKAAASLKSFHTKFHRSYNRASCSPCTTKCTVWLCSRILRVVSITVCSGNSNQFSFNIINVWMCIVTPCPISP